MADRDLDDPAGPVLAELRRAEARLSVQYASALVLAESATCDEAIGRLLRVVAEELDLDVGEYWGLDRTANLLRLEASWSASAEAGLRFVAGSGSTAFGPGEGLAGRIWAAGDPGWVEDLSRDHGLLRAPLAAECGLRGAFGFPIADESGLVAVMTFLTRRPLEPDEPLMKALATLGRQIGQFVVRRHAEHEVSRLNARLNSVLDSATQAAIVATDLAGTITTFNAGAENMLGYRREEVVGRATPEVFHLDDEVRSHASKLSREFGLPVRGFAALVERARRGDHDEREWTYVRKGGGLLTVSLQVTAIADASGRAVGFLGIARDVTRAKEIEEDLRRAKEAAVAASRSKSEFLANMSHEVRTPIAAVLGCADMLLDPLLSPPERDQALQAIRRNGSHLLQLINDVLDLSKIEAGKMGLEPIPYSPWQVVLEVISALGGRADEGGLTLDAIPSDDLPAVVLMDPTRVRQILLNLVSNAIKFSGRSARVVVRVGAEPPGPDGRPGLTLEVEDEGIGMTAEQLELVFAPFQQGDPSTTRRFGGTGLGLSITRRLVDAMGGAIVVRSEPGRGSRFTVRLPLAPHAPDAEWLTPAELPTHAAPEPSPRDRPSAVRLSGRVLLAEDSPDNRRVLVYHLSRLGLSVETAENGRVAVEKASRAPYALILMDMQMPELDGYGAASSLRRSGFTAPVVALTAHAMPEDRDKCLRAGCTAYLTKPVDPAALAETLARFLPAAQTPTGREPIASEFEDDPGLAPLLADYVSSLAERVDQLRESLSRGDLACVSKVAHQTRGVGAMFGYPCLTETAGLLEDAVKEGQGAELIGELVEEFAGLAGRIGRGLAPG